MFVSLSALAIGYDLRACDQPVVLSQGVDAVSFDTPDGPQITLGRHILRDLHAAGYSARFSESALPIPGGYRKGVAARALPSIT